MADRGYFCAGMSASESLRLREDTCQQLLRQLTFALTVELSFQVDLPSPRNGMTRFATTLPGRKT